MNFVAPFARRGKAGRDNSDHAVPDWNGITDFQRRFVGAPSEGLACRFIHLSIVAHLPAFAFVAATTAAWTIRLWPCFFDA
jgi:hypothetical protein